MCLVQLRDGNPYFGQDYNMSAAHGWAGDYAAAPFGLSERLQKVLPREIAFENAARNAPNDARAQLVALEAETRRTRNEEFETPIASASRGEGLSPRIVAGLEKYDRILPRFPRDAALHAARLRLTVLGGVTNRQTPDYPKELIAKKPPISKAQLERAIAIAQQGSRAEPDNCFFDMMIAYFLLAGYRDKEAIEIVHRAAQKPRYDDHVADLIRAQTAFTQTQRTVLLEDKVALWASVLLPHLAHMRGMARLMVVQGQNAERAGNHALALQIYGDTASLGARMRDASATPVTALVGMAIESVAWLRGQKVERTAEDRDGSAARRLIAQNFAVYARAHNRPDLARGALREMETNIVLGARISRSNERGPLRGETLDRVLNFWWAALALLSQCVLASAAWLAVALARRLAGRENSDKNADEKPVRAVDAASIALATSGVCLAILFALNSFAGTGLSQSTPFFSDDSNSTQLDANTLTFLRRAFDLAPILVGAMLCFFALVWRNYKAHRQLLREGATQSAEMESSRRLGVILRAGALLISGVLFMVFFLWPYEQWFPQILTAVAVFALPFCIRKALRAAGGKTAGAAGFDAAARLKRLLLFGVLAIVYALLAGAFLRRNAEGFLLVYAATIVLLLMPIFVNIVLSIARWLRAPHRPAALSSYGLRWFQASLGAMIVISSVAYLAVTLASLPARNQIEEYMNQVNAQGEMAFVRAQP